MNLDKYQTLGLCLAASAAFSAASALQPLRADATEVGCGVVVNETEFPTPSQFGSAKLPKGECKVLAWHLQPGDDWDTPAPERFDQTPATSPHPCRWTQVDLYRYGTEDQKSVVDGLDDDGFLQWIDGKAEDSAVYLRSDHIPPTGCATSSPSPTPTPSGSPSPSPSPSASVTPSPDPTPSTEPTPGPSITPTASSTTSPAPVPSSTFTRGGPSRTPSPTAEPVPSAPPGGATPTSTPTETRAEAPVARPTVALPPPGPVELAQTGGDGTYLLVALGAWALVAGVILVRIARREREH
ncbi:MAG: LPXTG cell wall anchor domain-containing protein [Dermatophilaceae bacterium]